MTHSSATGLVPASGALAPTGDRKLNRQITQVERALALQRAVDVAHAQRAAGRISDITKVTRHGLNAASMIALETELAVLQSPWAEQQLRSVAVTGVLGIRAVVADLADPLT